jgi:hypothetical protein
LTLATALLPEAGAAAVTAPVLAFGLAASGWLFVHRSRRLAPQERRAWTLVGIGFSLAAAGVVVHGLTWLVAGDVATFGPIDVIWLAGYAVGIVGIASLPHTAGSKWHRIRLLLDGLIGAVAVGSILWTLTLHSVASGLGEAPFWDRVVGTAYVALDAAVLVTLMMVVIKRSSYRFDRRLVLFGLGGIPRLGRLRIPAVRSRTQLRRGSADVLAERGRRDDVRRGRLQRRCHSPRA